MIYFVSDAHLGSLLETDTQKHEKKLVDWLESIRKDAEIVYLLGDLFDFWFEYKTVVPKGYVRFLGKLAEMVDTGIKIHFFTGNHDIWTFGYLEKEVGLIVHKEPLVVEHYGKRFFIAHGDGLTNNDDHAFKLLRWIFHNKTAQKMFAYLPPRLGQKFGYTWSKSNRLKHRGYKYRGEENENLVVYAKNYFIEHSDTDIIVFGHRHIDLDLSIENGKKLYILGDFIEIFSYGIFDGEKMNLAYLPK